MKKLLGAADPFRALLWMRTAGVLNEILPETEKWGIDSVPGLVLAEGKFGWPSDPMLRLAAIVPPVADRLNAMAERLKMSGGERKFLQQFADFPDVADSLSEPQLRALLYERGSEGVVARLKLKIASAVAKGDDDFDALGRIAAFGKLLKISENWQRPAFPLKGSDLAERGVSPGPEMGNILSRLERDWIASDFTRSKDDLLAMLAP